MNELSQNIGFDLSMFEIVDGMVNLTKVCQYFGKEVSNWLKAKSTKEFLNEFKLENSDLPNGGITILKGNFAEGSNQGTYAVREIALELARWISPKFAVWSNKQLDTLLQTGKVELQPQKQEFALPQNYKEALQQLLAQIEVNEILQLQAEIDKPKVEFATQLLETINAIDFATASKAMNLSYGRNTLFAKCRELKILDRNNIPYQEYIDREYFRVLETSFLHPKSGDRILTTKTLLTAKGQQYLIKKLKSA